MLQLKPSPGAEYKWLEDRALTRFSISLLCDIDGKSMLMLDDGLGDVDDRDAVDADPETKRESGMRKENRLPLLTVDSTRNCPPSCSTILATTARPSPAKIRYQDLTKNGGKQREVAPTPTLPLSLGSEDSTCSNSRKMCSNLSGGMPEPVSATRISTAV